MTTRTAASPMASKTHGGKVGATRMMASFVTWLAQFSECQKQWGVGV